MCCAVLFWLDSLRTLLLDNVHSESSNIAKKFSSPDKLGTGEIKNHIMNTTTIDYAIP
jgi:hypothetical protein